MLLQIRVKWLLYDDPPTLIPFHPLLLGLADAQLQLNKNTFSSRRYDMVRNSVSLVRLARGPKIRVHDYLVYAESTASVAAWIAPLTHIHLRKITRRCVPTSGTPVSSIAIPRALTYRRWNNNSWASIHWKHKLTRLHFWGITSDWTENFRPTDKRWIRIPFSPPPCSPISAPICCICSTSSWIRQAFDVNNDDCYIICPVFMFQP